MQTTSDLRDIGSRVEYWCPSPNISVVLRRRPVQSSSSCARMFPPATWLCSPRQPRSPTIQISVAPGKRAKPAESVQRSLGLDHHRGVHADASNLRQDRVLTVTVPCGPSSRLLDELTTLLRAKGGRVSAVRLSILQVMSSTEGPMSCDEITAQVRGVSASTVYRFLSQLEDWGLARHSHLGYRTAAYALGDAHTLPRYAVCQDCATPIPFPAELLRTLEQRLQEDLGFTADFVHFSIVGICQSCEAAAADRPRSFTHSHS